MLHIVAFIWFSVLAASHFLDHSLSFISANIYIFFNVSFCEDFFFLLIISLIIVTLRMTPVQPAKHHFPVAKRCLKCILSGIPLIGSKLSIELFINFPEFPSSDSQ